MKRVTISIGIVFLLFSTAELKQSDKCDRADKIAEVILSLSSRLTNEISGMEDNFIISPLSISAALAMLYAGAGGITKNQMHDALFSDVMNGRCPDKKLLQGYRDLILSLKSENEIMTLIAANSVFVQKGYQVSPEYMQKVTEYFDSEINYEDFLNEEQLSMKNINQWVSEKTRGQVNQLLNEPLDPATVMVLANAIYFKGLWVHPFTNTWSSLFHTTNGTSKIVTFMKLHEDVDYYYDADTQLSFLELPYTGGNISMLLILPRNTRDFPNFQMSNQALLNIRLKLKKTNVMVGLPKVKLEYRRELTHDMSKFGMSKLFSDRADLTGIREQNDLHVSLMIHKAVIEIDEKGSRASGLTGIGVVSRNRPAHQALFWANHPFLFYIIDKNMETILFVGRVANP